MKTTTQTTNAYITPWLAMLFALLKITGAIHWSWLWIFSPIWIGWLFVLGVFAAVLVVLAVTLFIKGVIHLAK